MIKIKVKKNPVPSIRKRLEALRTVVNDADLKRDLAKSTRDMVYKRVKAGRGVNSDRRSIKATSHKRLKPLSKPYVRFRRTGWVSFKAKQYFKKGGTFYEVKDVNFYVGIPALGEFGAPARSNLTLSGEMLKSMQFEIKKFGFTILIPETKRRGGSLTNAQLARYHSESGRPFMALTSGESRIIQSRMKSQVQKRIRPLLR